MKSILQKHKRCFVCGSRENLECHHIFYGRAYRHLSEKYGLKVWLCTEHHRGNLGVHGRNRSLGLRLMRLAQREFEKTHSRAEFMKLFTMNRLDEEAQSFDCPIAEAVGKNNFDVDNCFSFDTDRNIPGWDCK